MSSTDLLPSNETNTQNSRPMLLHSLELRNFLSFGDAYTAVQFRPLNLLIGPNGSGKSNLIEAVNVLRATPSSFQNVIRKGGGVHEWMWKGTARSFRSASLIAHLEYRSSFAEVWHRFDFDNVDQIALADCENIARVPRSAGLTDEIVYDFRRGEPAYVKLADQSKLTALNLYDQAESVLSQLKDSIHYPEITYLAQQYSQIKIYREWQFGRNNVLRQPQRADMRNDRLEEDFSNLGLFLNRLQRTPQAKNNLLRYLRDIYEGVSDYQIIIEGGTVQVFLTEGDYTIPATRLSDGTLRYLCLLAILCDPTPPPLICIEEPELGLHPDIIPKIAELLVEASQRTQLIVTTHSDILIDAMSDRPESVLVCEKHNGQTEIKRLSKEDLSEWLQEYRLGELWMRGNLGGTRW